MTIAFRTGRGEPLEWPFACAPSCQEEGSTERHPFRNVWRGVARTVERGQRRRWPASQALAFLASSVER